jgi:MarR family transcriptional regulator, negative regulator of the multidrug operon emrRAB
VDERSLNVVAALVVALYDELAEGFVEAGAPNPSAASALATIHASPDDGIDALSRIVGLTASGTVRLVSGLVDEGLVEKRPGHDARAVSLRLTKAGRRVAARVLGSRRQRIRAAVAGLTSAEQQQFADLAERIIGQLTSDRERADRICRLCDYSVCPDEHCPVERAVSS